MCSVCICLCYIIFYFSFPCSPTLATLAFRPFFLSSASYFLLQSICTFSSLLLEYSCARALYDFCPPSVLLSAQPSPAQRSFLWLPKLYSLSGRLTCFMFFLHKFLKYLYFIANCLLVAWVPLQNVRCIEEELCLTVTDDYLQHFCYMHDM